MGGLSTYLLPFLISCAMTFLNEMGDKSQLMSMAFATKYRLYKVFLGIFLAISSLNLLAVFFGTVIASIPNFEIIINLVSSILFLIFSVLNLKSDKNEVEPEKKQSHSVSQVFLVFVPFFLSEMGDKTQIVTITLAARFKEAWFYVLLGSTLGMLIADGIGIFFGKVLNSKVPQKGLKLLSSCLFLFFGISGLFQWLITNAALPLFVTVIISTCTGIITISLGLLFSKISHDRYWYNSSLAR